MKCSIFSQKGKNCCAIIMMDEFLCLSGSIVGKLTAQIADYHVKERMRWISENYYRRIQKED